MLLTKQGHFQGNITKSSIRQKNAHDLRALTKIGSLLEILFKDKKIYFT